jgi:hypothetical protein
MVFFLPFQCLIVLRGGGINRTGRLPDFNRQEQTQSRHARAEIVNDIGTMLTYLAIKCESCAILWSGPGGCEKRQ